jgi:hypothetical protein
MRIAYSGLVQEPRSGIDVWDEVASDREARFSSMGFHPARPEVLLTRHRGDRVVLAILGLCAFVLVAAGS